MKIDRHITVIGNTASLYYASSFGYRDEATEQTQNRPILCAKHSDLNLEGECYVNQDLNIWVGGEIRLFQWEWQISPQSLPREHPFIVHFIESNTKDVWEVIGYFIEKDFEQLVFRCEDIPMRSRKSNIEGELFGYTPYHNFRCLPVFPDEF